MKIRPSERLSDHARPSPLSASSPRALRGAAFPASIADPSTTGTRPRASFEALEPRMLLSADLLPGEVPSFIDDDGTEVTFRLEGAGQVLWQSVAGEAGRLAVQIEIREADVSSRLTATATGGDGAFRIEAIRVSGSLGALLAPSGTLTGLLDVDGVLDTLSLREVLDGIVLADAVRRIDIDRDFSGVMSLRGASTGMTLGMAGVGGSIHGEWQVSGRAGAIRAHTIAADWRGSFTDPVTSLVTVGDFSGTLVTPALQQLTVGGDLAGADLIIGASLGRDARIGGTGADADRFGSGNLNRVRVNGAVTDTRVRVGVDPIDGIFDNGNDTLAGPGRIQEFLAGGAISGSVVVADTLPLQIRELGARVTTTGVPAFRPQPVDALPPEMVAALANDTGVSSIDALTTDPTIVGELNDLGGVGGLFVRFDDAFIDVSHRLEDGGAFSLDRATFELALGRPLDDGDYVVGLRGADRAGNLSTIAEVSFRLDTSAPGITAFGLATTSAAGTSGAGDTASARVVLMGTSEAGTTVELLGDGDTALAGHEGRFQFVDVPLALGDNTVTVQATDAAGNRSQVSRTVTRIASTGQDPVLAWTGETLEAIRRDAALPAYATRALALVSLAIHDVVNAVEGAPGFAISRAAVPGASAAAAVAQAARDVLTALFPGQRVLFDERLDAHLATETPGAARGAGVALGRDIAAGLIATREQDGWQDFAQYTGGTAPGQWRPTGPMYDVAQLPEWADVTPFVLATPDQFRPPPPPPLGSEDYARDVEEVRAVGRADSAARTSEQTETAHFWADGPGTYTPPGHWNRIALEIAASQGNSLTANARLFALLNMALADASIAAWDAKYHHGLWRPETAVAEAAFDGNAATLAEDGWRPLLISPNHPEYVSGHSTYSAAAARILSSAFGTDFGFDTTSIGLPGITRSFTGFDAAAEEAGRSRILGGIHYEFSNQAGQALGRAIADQALRRFEIAIDDQPPVVALAGGPAIEFTNGNVTIAGRATDSHTGVVSASYRMESTPGSVVIPLDGEGQFRIATTFALDGSADGMHLFQIEATDGAGNVSREATHRVVLDTRPPVVEITSFADGATVESGARLRGNVDITGSPLVLLTAAVGGGAPVPVPFDAAGQFVSVLDLADRPAGTHTVTITARDAAGNTTVLAHRIVLDAPSPLTVTGAFPADGAVGVGVTFRPHVTFSRPVDPVTLSADTFFATGPDGARLPATIVMGGDHRSAWLFPETPWPDAARITITLRGDAVRDAAGVLVLDGDGDGVPGGDRVSQFTTVSTAGVIGTRLIGRVLDPGSDLKPMTFDDVRRGADGVIQTTDDLFLNPIANARVFILGREDAAVFTDATGRFELTDVPAGNVKIAIDGRSASNAPEGVFWPEMVMDADLLPGEINTVMGSMGSREERAAHREREEVYLPRLRTAMLTAVSDGAPTVITMHEAGAPDLTAAQRQQVRLVVTPGSVIGEDGEALTGAQIGIGTVPPELVRDMLPPGLMQHTFDITIQAPGAGVFASPLQLALPNVFDASPGTQLNFLSFDHTTGRLVIEGTATVSEDGLSVVTDPGTGITKPGWHGLTPPGSPGGNGPPPGDGCDPPPGAEPLTPSPEIKGLESRLFWSDTDTFELKISNPTPDESGECGPGPRVDSLNVDIVVEDKYASLFLEGLESQAFTLGPGGDKTIRVNLKDLLGTAAVINGDDLYGARVEVRGWVGDLPAELLIDETFYLYRYLDVDDGSFTNPADAHADGVLEFADTLSDGAGGVQRIRDVTGQYSAESTPRLELDSALNFSTTANSVIFDPQSVQDDHSANLLVIGPDGVEAGRMNLLGDGTPKYTIDINRPQLLATLHSIFIDALLPGGDVDPVLFSPPEWALIDTEPERAAFADDLALAIDALFAVAGTGISVGPATGNGDATIHWTTTPDVAAFGDSSAPTPADGIDLDEAAALGLAFSAHLLMPGERDFLVASVMNQSPTTNLTVHVDSHAEFSMGVVPFVLTRAELLQALAATVAHEVAHTLGLVHTAQGLAPSHIFSEEQRIELLGGSATDTFTLAFNGQTTFPLARNAPAADVEAALHTLGTVGGQNLVVGGGNGGPYVVIFDGLLRSDDVPQITGTGSGSLIVDASTTAHGFGDVNLGAHVPGGDADLMYGGAVDYPGLLRFQPGLSEPGLRLGLHIDWQSIDALDTLRLWFDHLLAGGGGFFSALSDAGASGPGPSDSVLFSGPALFVVDDDGSPLWSDLDFGVADLGDAASPIDDRVLTLRNLGSEPVVLRRVSSEPYAGAFQVETIPRDTVIAPRASLELAVSFDPGESGPHTGRIVIETADGIGSRTLGLSGVARSPTGDVRLEIGNNNVGGHAVDGGPKILPAFATIRNTGADDLRLTGLRIAAGEGPFMLSGLPLLSEDAPYVLAPDAVLSFGVRFDPDVTGLARAMIELTTDDPETPVLRHGIVGTGIGEPATTRDPGDDYVALESTFDPRAPVLRAISNADGDWSFFLPPATAVHHVVFDPVSGLVAHGWDTTATSGRWSPLTTGRFGASTAPDTDFDGLPDDIEFAIGSAHTTRDTDGDGIDDFIEIRNGTSPVDVDAARLGVIATLDLEGEARAVALGFDASGAAAGRTIAAVATGGHGIAFVDLTDPGVPALLRAVDLPGAAVDVAFDASRRMAIVASGAGGLHWVDLEGNVRSVAGDARAVQIVDGLVVAAMAGALHTYDSATGELLQTLPLDVTGPVDELVTEGVMLYATSVGDRLVTVDLASGALVARDAITLPWRAGSVFVADGVAYVGRDDGFNGGYGTIDVRDPGNLSVISEPDTTGIATSHLALTGSGLAVGVGSLGAGGTTSALDVVDVRDPQDTDRFLARIALPRSPEDLALLGGRAIVAGGAAGLLVVNYLAADTLGQPPSVVIDLAGVDIDPLRPGIQVAEGAVVPVGVTLTDDVQVGRVEWLMAGEAIATREAFPFGTLLSLPTLRSHGAATVTLQVRATDTGGNVGLSATEEIELVADLVAPDLLSVNVADGDVKGRNFRTIVLAFSEPMDVTTIPGDAVRLAGPDGAIAPLDIAWRRAGTELRVAFPLLGEGDFTLEIDQAALVDRAGNAVGTESDAIDFGVRPYSAVWINPAGGKWHDPANWSTGILPGPDDDVLIDLPEAAIVIVDFPGGPPIGGFPPGSEAGDVAIGSLTSNAGLRIAGAGTLTLANASRIAGLLTLESSGEIVFDGVTTLGDVRFDSGTMAGDGDIDIAGDFTWHGGRMTGAGHTVIEGDWLLEQGPDLPVSFGTRVELDGGRSLENRGRGVVREAEILLNGADPGAGRFLNAAGASLTFDLSPAGPIEVLGFHTFDREPPIPPRFENAGTLHIAGEGLVDIDVAFASTGLLQVEASEVRFRETTTIDGAVDVTATGSLALLGPASALGALADIALGTQAGLRIAGDADVTVAAGARISGAGSVGIEAGTLRFASDATVSALVMTGGTVDTPMGGVLAVTDRLAWLAGTLTGGGTVVAGTRLDIGAPDRSFGGSILDGGTTVENRGVAVIHARATLTFNGAGSPGSGTLVNAEGASLTLASSAGTSIDVRVGNRGPLDDGTDALIDNRGTLRKSGEGTAIVRARLESPGAVEVAGGELSLGGPSSALAGRLDVIGGSVLSVLAGRHTIAPTATVTSAPTSRFVARGTGILVVGAGSDVDLAGRLDVSGGQVHVDGSLAIDDLLLSTGTVRIGGSLALRGVESVWTGGAMNGGGTLSIAGGARLGLGGPESTRRQVLGALTIENDGTVADLGHNGSLTVELDGAVVLENRGTFSIEGAGQWGHQSAPPGQLTLRNTGAITKSGHGGEFTLNATTLESTGSISVQLGTLRFPGTVEHTGETRVAAEATLVLGAQTIVGPFPAAPPAPTESRPSWPWSVLATARTSAMGGAVGSTVAAEAGAPTRRQASVAPGESQRSTATSDAGSGLWFLRQELGRSKARGVVQWDAGPSRLLSPAGR